jgi:hypothetical protein
MGEFKMTEWVIPCNVKKEYDVVGAFSKLKKINWKQSTNIEVGDVVYVYAGDPIKSILYKCIVNKVNIDEPDIDDSEFTLNNANYSVSGRYMEIELLEAYDNKYLSYEFLLENGLRTVQGPSRVTSRLSKYLYKMTVKFDPNLKIGQRITHEDLMKIFQCGNMGGMLPSNKTNTLVILSYPGKGPYHDRWEGDVLHYTGEGQIGDQLLKNNNKKLADSNVNGLGVHLFDVPESNVYVYSGQVRLVGKPYQDIQPDVNGNNRSVWIFPVSVIEEKVDEINVIPWVDKGAALKQKINLFQLVISEYKEREIRLEELREHFVNDYKMQVIINVTKEDYVVGQGRHDTFCYRLENELEQLGNIHGSTSAKFGLYYGVKGSDKEYKYRTTKLKFGEDPDQALQVIKEQIVKLIMAGDTQDNTSIKLNSLSPLFKGKILSVYYPEKYLSIFSKEHLEYFLSKLDLPFDKDDELDMQIKLLNWKESNEYTRKLTNFLFASFLYFSFGNISEINKKVDDEQEERDKAYPKDYIAKVNISIEQWKRLLQNKEIFYDEDNEIIKRMYQHDNHAATCLEISTENGIEPSDCEQLISELGKRVSNDININPVIDGHSENNVWWSILFWGSYRDDGHFEWKLRPKLVKALKSVYPELEIG